MATRGKRSRLKALGHYLRRRQPAPELTIDEIESARAAARAWADELNGRGGDDDGR